MIKRKEIKQELEKILVEDYFDTGWEYTYWGIKVIINGNITIEQFYQFISEELDAKGYEIDLPKDVTRDISNYNNCQNYYACLYSDKYDGESYGVVIYSEQEVKEILIKKIEKIRSLTEEKIRSLTEDED